MKNLFKVLIVTSFLNGISLVGYTATITAIASGSWTNTANWNLGRLPMSGDDIIIPASRIMNIPFFTDIDLRGPEVTTIRIIGTIDFNFSDITIDSGDGDKITIEATGSITPEGAIFFDALFNDPIFASNFISGPITGPATIQNGALPIVLLTFNIEEVNDYFLEVKWTTASEENNDFFSVERSRDGISYETIGSLGGSGNSTAENKYSFIDKNPLLGLSYYRLKQTDFDGRSETFSPISIEFTSLQDGELGLIPNPVDRGQTISIASQADGEETLTITIFDMLGETILTDKFKGSTYVFDLDQDTKPGIYFVEISSIKTQKRGRLLVK